MGSHADDKSLCLVPTVEAGADTSTQTHCGCPLLCPTPNTAPDPDAWLPTPHSTGLFPSQRHAAPTPQKYQRRWRRLEEDFSWCKQPDKMQTTQRSSTLRLEKRSTREKGASGHHPEPTVQLVSQLPGDKAITTLSKYPSLNCLEIRPGLGCGWGEDKDAPQAMPPSPAAGEEPARSRGQQT